MNSCWLVTAIAKATKWLIRFCDHIANRAIASSPIFAARCAVDLLLFHSHLKALE